MIVGAIDIGTNSMRLLINDAGDEVVREIVVTGLGADVDHTGRLRVDRVEATLATLERFGEIMNRHGVERRRAVATSATRDAANGGEFVARAHRVLGVEPEVISGTEEASLSFLGATGSTPSHEAAVVIDIGGGSTEFVYGEGSVTSAVSIDLGSIRLTDRSLPSRPASRHDLDAARVTAARAFEAVSLPGSSAQVIGVAGAFTSLSAIAMDLPAYDRARVHQSVLTVEEIRKLAVFLSEMTMDETAAIPSLDPRRAPVILAGAILAEAALAAVGVDQVTVSEHDLLDGVAMSVLGSGRHGREGG